MTDYDITETMMAYGGSFANRLAFAWRAADNENQARLKAAFPELWEEYAELAKLRHIQTQR